MSTKPSGKKCVRCKEADLYSNNSHPFELCTACQRELQVSKHPTGLSSKFIKWAVGVMRGQYVEVQAVSTSDPKKLPLRYLIECARELYARKSEIEARHQKEWQEYDAAVNDALSITGPKQDHHKE